jgi:phosphatidylcholine synthase
MWLGLGLLIDGIDGTIARFLKVSVKLPHIDGHMLDSIIDYVNYIFIPAFMLHYFKILPETIDTVLPATIMVISVISYSNKNTKTDENYYVGFPAIWNVVVLYLVIFDYSVLVNTAILIFLIVLKIIPIRFVHPFRTKSFKKSTLVVSLSWFMFTPLTVICREYSYLSDYYEYFLSAWLLISSYYVFLTLFLNSDKFVKIYNFLKKFCTTNKILSYKNDLSAEKI